MNIHRSIAIFLIASTTSICFSCGNKVSENPESPESHHDESNVVELSPAQYKTAGIELALPALRQISGTIRANGELDVPPQQLVTVSIPLGGFLKSTELLQGVRVKKGQLVATVESIDFIQIQQDYLEAKNQFEFAKTDYDRQKELDKENINSQKTLQQARSTFENWQAKTNGLRAKLAMLNINLTTLEQGTITNTVNVYSPISGYVTEVNVNIGKFLNPSDILFEIVNTEHLHAELTIFEKDIPRVKIGQKVRFTLANEDTERIATIYLIGRKITTDRTIRIHCHIDTEDAELLPGMYLKAFVETGGAKVPALPDEAIVDYQGKKYIFISAENELSDPSKDQKENIYHFTMQEIQTDNSELGYTAITLPEELDEKKTMIVVKGAYALLSKMKNSEEDEGHH